MVPEDDARVTLEFPDHFVIQPTHAFWNRKDFGAKGGEPCADGYCYSSDTNDHWLTDAEIRALVESIEKSPTSDPAPQVSEPSFIVGG
jgi:UDP-N-acetylglucosamine 4,6-dehydratase